jgi:hypothetical protein
METHDRRDFVMSNTNKPKETSDKPKKPDKPLMRYGMGKAKICR